MTFMPNIERIAGGAITSRFTTETIRRGKFLNNNKLRKNVKFN